MTTVLEYKLYIDGGYRDSSDKETFETLNPATGKVLARVQRAGRENGRDAIAHYTQLKSVYVELGDVESAL